MEKTWRWFGKSDKITLAMLKQIGVEGIVTALHDVPNGEVWPREKIRELREYIESYGMRWSVVESLPVCEAIKYAGADRDRLIENYKESLKNLGLEGRAFLVQESAPMLLRRVKGADRSVAGPFDLVFLDPPYRKNFTQNCLDALVQCSWLAPGAFVSVEVEEGLTLNLPDPLSVVTQREFGQTTTLIARMPGND